MGLFIFLVILGTSIWVFFDARAIGIKHDQVKGLANMTGPGMWLVGSLLLWIIIFPLYLKKRSAFQKANGLDPEKDKFKLYAGWASIALVIGIIIFEVAGVPWHTSAPSCGDELTKKLVISTAMREAKRQLKNTTSWREDRSISDAQWDKEWIVLSEKIQMTLDNIRTKDFNKQIGTYACAADLKVNVKGEKKTIPISYLSELSADRSGGFIVEVRGLH